MKILVADNGLCVEGAIMLAAAGNEVAYHTPWKEAFPKSASTSVGKGLEGITRVDELLTAVNKAQMVVCFDSYSEDLVEACRRSNKPIFGAGGAERLEHDRSFCRDLQKKKGMPVIPYVEIKGMTKLMEYLKKNTNKWVKIDKYRGDIETFHHESWDVTFNDILGPLLRSFGPNGEDIEFIVEDHYESKVPEVGVDTIVDCGYFFDPFLIGYEDKDRSYLGSIQSILPEPLQAVNNSLREFFSKTQAKTMFSTEVLDGRLTDPCVRAPHPPFAVELELFSNLPEIIKSVALEDGKCSKIVPTTKYGAAITIHSDWVDDHWCEVTFEPKYRHLVKLQRACKKNGHYYALPGSFVVCTVVGLGQTPEAAIKECKEVAETVQCRDMRYDVKSLEDILAKTVPQGKKGGIEF